MQLRRYRLIKIIWSGLLMLSLQLIVSAQPETVEVLPGKLQNPIGAGVLPIIQHNPLTAPISPARPAGARRPFGDFFGTGRTSFAVVERSGIIKWKLQSNGSNESRFITWGRDTFNYTDYLNPGYFDADNIADVAVWRQDLQNGTGTYFINPSTAPDSMQVTPWGIDTDSASKVSADYDGDGRDDLTVARRVNGSWVWYYYRSSDHSVGVITFGIAGSGFGTDSPRPGADYNGDGRDDITVVRYNADGTNTYYVGDSQSGQLILVQPWGLTSVDFHVTGDFVGDSRADFAVWRGFQESGNGIWYVKENGGDLILTIPFGLASTTYTDVPIRGDYNGDGKDDIAVYRTYRNSQVPDNNTFYWLNSPGFDTLGAYQFGALGDTPVAR